MKKYDRNIYQFRKAIIDWALQGLEEERQEYSLVVQGHNVRGLADSFQKSPSGA